MTEQEILQAMSNILTPIREDIQDIRADLNDVKKT